MIHACSAAYYADFSPINGTFQNYNPVRRLLDGQIPYCDFQDYLGFGHLYIGAVFTAVFGGNYRCSLIAFSFLTFGSLALLTCVMGIAIFKKKEIAVALTNVILLMLITQPFLFTNFISGDAAMLEALKCALEPGNSARFIRGMILPIFILLMWLGYYFFQRIEFKNTFLKENKILIGYAGCGMLSGFAFVWSNDYGISCWICMVIMAFWIALARMRNLAKTFICTITELLSSLISLFICIEIFTVGHFDQWFSATLGAGGYQSWYYNSSKSYYLYDVDFSYIMLIQAGFCLAYMIKIFLMKGNATALRRYGIPAFANMVCFCAVNEYQLLSGGGAREVALSTLFLTIVFELCCFFSIEARKDKEERTLLIISVIIASAWICSSAKEQLVSNMADLDGVYVEAMGGNLTSLGEDLLITNEFLDGNNFWATYASAQEVVSDTYQPSGTDYIIHVLGDAQRDNYLENFWNGDFKYAATIRKEYTDWEYWVERANWFFYRELYKNWHPVYANTYELYWERNAVDGYNTSKDDINIEIQSIDDASSKIIIQTNEYVNGIADVYIDYSVNKRLENKLSVLLFQSELKVQNTGTIMAGDSYYEMNYLRPVSAEYIPVSVVNGYGEVTLTATPEKTVYLDLKEAKCDAIYTAGNYAQAVNLTDDNWSAGVDKEKNRLLLKYSELLMNKLQNVDHIQVNEQKFNIISIENDDQWIRLTVDNDVTACAYPAILIFSNR